MTYTIDPSMSFGEVIAYYEKYIDETKAAGKKPLSIAVEEMYEGKVKILPEDETPEEETEE